MHVACLAPFTFFNRGGSMKMNMPCIRPRVAALLLGVSGLAEILFRYEAPALADAANGALRRDAEH